MNSSGQFRFFQVSWDMAVAERSETLLLVGQKEDFCKVSCQLYNPCSTYSNHFKPVYPDRSDSRIPPGHQQIMQTQVAVNQDTSSANLSNCPRTFRQILRCWTNPNLPLLFCCHRVSRVSMSFSGIVFTCQSYPILQAVDMSHAIPQPSAPNDIKHPSKGDAHLRQIPTPEWMRKQVHQDKRQRLVDKSYIYSGFKHPKSLKNQVAIQRT